MSIFSFINFEYKKENGFPFNIGSLLGFILITCEIYHHYCVVHIFTFIFYWWLLMAFSWALKNSFPKTISTRFPVRLDQVRPRPQNDTKKFRTRQKGTQRKQRKKRGRKRRFFGCCRCWFLFLQLLSCWAVVLYEVEEMQTGSDPLARTEKTGRLPGSRRRTFETSAGAGTETNDTSRNDGIRTAAIVNDSLLSVHVYLRSADR